MSVCLKRFTLSSSVCFSLNLSANFQTGLTCECVWMRTVASMWYVCHALWDSVCVCVMGVPLKSCCCLPLRQCLVSAARLGWTGSPSPLPPASPSPPITFPTAKPCRMTTQRAATTCCHTLTWRGTKTLGQRCQIPGGPQPCRVYFQPCSNTQTM